MSKNIHLLKIFKELCDVKLLGEKCCIALLCVGKRNDLIFRDIVEDINQENNLNIIINNILDNTNAKVINPSKALTLHRLKLAGALVAQVKGYALKPSLSFKLDFKNTPERFQTKFQNILVDGFWLLGRMIADSLSDDCSVNCGNPFGFSPGDLAFWWAGCVILDWAKNENSRYKKKSYLKCDDFYKDHSISRKFKYYQNSGSSSFSQRLFYDFSKNDLEMFTLTIKSVRYKGHILLLNYSDVVTS